MAWVRFDDLYDDKRKVRRAWRSDPRAIGLHVMAITFTTRHRLDGRVPNDWIEEMIPRKADRERALSVLIDLRLFDSDKHGYVVHDYLDWNPSATDRTEKALAASSAASARWKRKGAA